MTGPGTPVDVDNPETFARAEVINKEWEYLWQTANLNIDTGAYTIYAIAVPVLDKLTPHRYRIFNRICHHKEAIRQCNGVTFCRSIG